MSERLAGLRKWIVKILIGSFTGAYVALNWVNNTDLKLKQFSSDVIELKAAQAEQANMRQKTEVNLTQQMGLMETRIVEKIGESSQQLNGRILLLEKTVEKKIP